MNLVHAFITCKVDKYNALFVFFLRITQRLKTILKRAARLVFNKTKFEHVTPLPIDFHWHPIKQHTIFKVLIVTYKELIGLTWG